MLLGFVATRLFKLPSWITPALCFNNTTSLPLLLVQSLEATGILSRLLASDSDTTSGAVKWAKSYFLVCAIVGNSLTFALGPKLLDGEESPEESDEEQKRSQANGNSETNHEEDIEQGQQNGHDNDTTNEETSLLPDTIVQHSQQLERKYYAEGKHHWDRFPPWLHSFLNFSYGFFNAPLIGAVIGAIIGLTPPLHRAFFNTQQEGGIFNAWLTTSIQNIGGLFATLQVVVVGVKLSSSL